MITLQLRCTIDPNQMADFRKYAEAEDKAITKSDSKILGYFLPTDFAGPTNEAIGVIDVGTLTECEVYRAKLAAHPLHKRSPKY